MATGYVSFRLSGSDETDARELLKKMSNQIGPACKAALEGFELPKEGDFQARAGLRDYAEQVLRRGGLVALLPPDGSYNTSSYLIAVVRL